MAMPGAISHWDSGEMTYKFSGEFPTNWNWYINQAAAHMERETFATGVNYNVKSTNQIAIEAWPLSFGLTRNYFGSEACDYAGTDGDDMACAYPVVNVGGIDVLDVRILANNSNHLSKIKIAIDPADVYDTSITPPSVRTKWTAADGP